METSPYRTGVREWFLIGMSSDRMWMWQTNDMLEVRVCENDGTPLTAWHTSPADAWAELQTLKPEA